VEAENPADGQRYERHKKDGPVVAAFGGRCANNRPDDQGGVSDDDRGRIFRNADGARRNKAQRLDLTPMVQIDVLEKPIERIKKTCAMMGIAEKFDDALPDLETFLEAEVAKGETRETRLTYDGLLYLKELLAKG
jgi:hypothetical protein